MKILAIADRRPAKPIKEYLAEQPIDLIVTLGDLDFFDIQDLLMIDTIPKIGVYGNHCSGSYMSELNIQNMHLQTAQINGLTFGGFQGCVRYKQNPDAIMCTQEEAQQFLKDFPAVDVMLTHAPPFGINDDQSEISHTGFIALREYIEKKPPKHWFHGHTYPTEDALIREHNGTQIHYIFGAAIVTI